MPDSAANDALDPSRAALSSATTSSVAAVMTPTPLNDRADGGPARAAYNVLGATCVPASVRNQQMGSTLNLLRCSLEPSVQLRYGERSRGRAPNLKLPPDPSRDNVVRFPLSMCRARRCPRSALHGKRHSSGDA